LVAAELPAVAPPGAALVNTGERSHAGRHFEQREVQAAIQTAAFGAQPFGIALGQREALV
jgi:hypothetical protein